MTIIRRYFLSILIILAVVVLSLAPMPEFPKLGDIPLWDKWVHFVMYGGMCSVLWFDYLRNGNSRRARQHDFYSFHVSIIAYNTFRMRELSA